MLALWLGPAYRSGMGIASEFAQQVEQLISVRLSEDGFRKSSKGGIFVKDVAPEVLCWVGLNKAGVKETGFEVNLVVGVRHQEVERQVAALLDEPWDPVIPPTLATNVGYLSPSGRYLGLSFSRSEDVSVAVGQLCALVLEFGVPFARKLSQLPELAQALQEGRYGIPQQSDYRLPVCHLMDGSPVRSAECVRIKLERVGDAADPAAARYRHFASKLLARIADSGEMAKGD